VESGTNVLGFRKEAVARNRSTKEGRGQRDLHDELGYAEAPGRRMRWMQLDGDDATRAVDCDDGAHSFIAHLASGTAPAHTCMPLAASALPTHCAKGNLCPG
jgi:hypothetical protein